VIPTRAGFSNLWQLPFRTVDRAPGIEEALTKTGLPEQCKLDSSDAGPRQKTSKFPRAGPFVVLSLVSRPILFVPDQGRKGNEPNSSAGKVKLHGLDGRGVAVREVPLVPVGVDGSHRAGLVQFRHLPCGQVPAHCAEIFPKLLLVARANDD
jgi:hypothetical protein